MSPPGLLRVSSGVTQTSDHAGRRRTRASWRIVAALSATETVSWGVLYYAFAVMVVPMRAELGFSTAELTGAFSLGLLVSAIAGLGVGRLLDRGGARVVMTAGSSAGAALVVGWSQVSGLTALYAVWAGIGLAMAAVLYEPAFVVLARRFPDRAERRRAMTAVTLVGALASFVFLPLAQALIDAYGWRDALLALAAVLALVTMPLHALALGSGGGASARSETAAPAVGVGVGDALRSAPFWLLSCAFVIASLASVAVTVHAIPMLVERGHAATFAAFAVGVVGLAQIPGRLLFGVAAGRLPRPAATAAVFALIAGGLAVVVSAEASGAVVAGLAVLGMGNGMTTLARATMIADLYGTHEYGSIASLVAAMTTGARAAGPVTAALYAAAFGYGALLWTLAGLAAIASWLGYAAERRATY